MGKTGGEARRLGAVAPSALALPRGPYGNLRPGLPEIGPAGTGTDQLPAIQRSFMKNAFDSADRESLGNRMDGLTLDRPALWGKMDCARMLAHLTDAVLMALGEISIPPRSGPLRLAPIRYAIIHVFPFPKGAPTAPRLVERRAESAAAEVEALKSAMERFAALAGQTEWVEHPAFGRMTEKDWGVLVYRHVDHHLRQFGV